MKQIRKPSSPQRASAHRVLRRRKRAQRYARVDKPAIQFIVEEAVRAGITDILIITNHGKSIMEDHFDAGAFEGASARKRKKSIR